MSALEGFRARTLWCMTQKNGGVNRIMRYTKATVVAIGAFMLVLPLAHLVSAGGTGHEEGDPMIITTPDGDGPISCAVYFADNMVFAPQWRTDGLVRIEMMIIDMTDLKGDPRLIDEGTIDLTDDYADDYPREVYPQYWAWNSVTLEWYWSQQLFLLDDSSRLDLTNMVSVSYIKVTITEDVPVDALDDEEPYIPYTRSFEAGWLPDGAYDRVIFSDLGREVNKHGGLIYGMLWDTAADPDDPTLPAAPVGEYRVDVQLGKVKKVSVDPAPAVYDGDIGDWYTVDFAVGHLYVGEGDLLDPAHPYVSLVPNEGEDRTIVTGQDEYGEDVVVYLYADLGVGLGGVSPDDTAWILIGQLIPQGPGGGNGGDSGDAGGNGQGNCGDKVRRR